jgi:hypothetical protein
MSAIAAPCHDQQGADQHDPAGEKAGWPQAVAAQHECCQQHEQPTFQEAPMMQ